MPKYISGRSKRRPQDQLSDDRYQYLGVDQSEPNLGDPVFPGETPPFGQQYITVSIEGYPGERYWIPNQGGIIPGSISIFDEFNLVGAINSITQLNIVGAAISASGNSVTKAKITLADSLTYSFSSGQKITQDGNAAASGFVFESTTNSGIVTLTTVTGAFDASGELEVNGSGIGRTPASIPTNTTTVGVAATIEVTPEYFSTNTQVVFNNNDEFDGALGLVYQNNSATDSSNVGLASVGIGTTFARRTLHVDGDIKLTGSIEDYNNSLGNTSDILIKNSSGGIEWIEQNSLSVGAAGTYYEVQFHGGTGTLAGADKLVYRSDLNGGQIGIGTTNPSKLLDVEGDSIFVGDVTFDGSTTDYDALWDRSANAFIVKDNAKFAAGTDSDLQIYHDGNDGYIDNNTGHIFIRNNVDNDDGSNIYIQAKKDKYSIICNDDQGVTLYYDNSVRAYTDSSGFRVSGRLFVSQGTSQFHGDVKFDGQTTGRDIYFNESVNSLYAYDNAQFRVGTGGDVRIYHDESNTYIEPASNGVGDLIVGSATTDIAKFVYNGGVSLYYQDVLKFDTIGVGVSVYDTAYIPNLITVGIATIDNIQIGHSDDNTINTSSGNLILDSDGGTVQVDDILFVNDTTQSDDKDSGSIYTQGGVGVEKNLNVGGSVGIASTAESTDKDTGALVVEGGVGIEKNLNVGGSVGIASTAESTDKDTGALVVEGGVGIEKNLNVGGASKFTGISTFSNNVDIDGHTELDDLNVSGIATLGVTTLTDVTAQQLNVSGMTTLGVTTASQLQVSGMTTLGITILTDTTTQQLFVSGISTLGNVFIEPVGTGASVGEKEPGVSGVVTFYGDGSGLRNVVAIGTGIDIQNSGSVVGSASTINFGNNLTGSLDDGVYTVNAADATRSIFSSYSDYASHSETSNGSYNLVGIGSTYIEVAAIQSDTPSGGDDFGADLACSADGKTIIVCASAHDADVDNVGAVYVFDREGNTYSQVGFFTGSYAESEDDFFGTSVACSADGKTIVVGAHRDNFPEWDANSGLVYVFDRVGNDFNEVGILTGSFADDGTDFFGYSVATSADGKTIVVGAHRDENTIYSDHGLVYVFDRVGNDFNEVGILRASDFDANDSFGQTVATSADGKTIVAGAPVHDGSSNSETNRGAVYVFDRVGNDFNEVGILTSSNSASGHYTFGRQLKISADGKTIVSSSYSNTDIANVEEDLIGHVIVFDRVGNDFNEVGILTAGTEYADDLDYFGRSLAISADGKTIVVGANQDEIDPSITSSGLVHVFNRQGNNFNRVGVITGSYAVDQNDYFGTSVAISADGKSIIAGAHYDEIGSPSSGGVVYVFDQTTVARDAIIATDTGVLITGDLNVTGDITAFYTSDERLKDNITPIDDPLAKVISISGNTFDWNQNSNKSGHDVGVIAQEIKEILPEAVTERDNGYLAVDYYKVIPLLIEAIKELSEDRKIITSKNGVKYHLVVDDDGNLSTEKV